MPLLADLVEVTCANEVFIATALLHREHPERKDFLIQEIVSRAEQENLHGDLRPSVNVHASSHCVANKEPKPARYRMLFATGKHTRRLLLPGDEAHRGRNGKILPDSDELPEQYLPLLEWARARYERARNATGIWTGGQQDQSATQEKAPRSRHLSGLLQARGIGAEMAAGIDPDDYLRELREGWE
jgi:hypothetical protein